MCYTKIFLVISIIILVVYIISYQLKEQYLQNDPMLKELKETLQPMFNNNKEVYTGNLTKLNYINLFETINLYAGDKSYTINKEKVFLCLKDENGSYYNKNMLLYVLLHELAHVICPEIGHTELFNVIFDELLEVATKNGIYDKHQPVIQDYCQY